MASKYIDMLTDTILRDGIETEVRLLGHPCRHLGTRIDARAKEKCENSAAYLPVYRCREFRLCSPFGQCIDSDLIHPCPGCAARTI